MAHELRSSIPRAFGAFLGGFARTTEVQDRAIPAIVSGRDVLIMAPTASGKTEAFAAPAAELVLARGGGSFRVLIVSPTRALANDLERRLEGRIQQLGVGLGRYTGEHKEKVGGVWPDVAILTPETLDSLLARRPRSLAGVLMVVLDEIHVIDGTTRGDHVRVLLHRLERAAKQRPQRVAASATVEDPRATATRYLRDAEQILVGGARQIRAKCFRGTSPAGLANHLTELAVSGFRKVLVFCNRRADVEDYAAKLVGRTPYRDAVFAHHGSLARTERERTERHFLDRPSGVVIATMTLEMGIDIGTIDYVLLMQPPSSVASLLQRIGRGNRRTSTVRAGFACDDPAQERLFRSLLTAGSRGEMLGGIYGFRPSVLVQQLLVSAGARGWIDAARGEDLLPRFALDEIAPTTIGEMLDALADAGCLDRSHGGRFVLAEKTEARYERGQLHSNIESDMVLEVVDRITGDVIGEVLPESARRMRLGGRARKVVMESGGRLLSDAGGRAESPTFRPRGVPRISLALARRVVEGLGGREVEIVQACVHGAVFLLHGLGTIGALFLEKLLDEEHGKGFVLRTSPFSLQLGDRIERLPLVEAAAVERFLGKHQRAVARLCAMGPMHGRLPKDLAERSVRRVSDVDAVAAFVRSARLVTPEVVSADVEACAPHL